MVHNLLVSEFNEFKPRLKFPKTRFQFSAGLNLENSQYEFKWKQQNLSHSLNLNRGSNSLDSAIGEKNVSDPA